jgi:hypothetical protein
MLNCADRIGLSFCASNVKSWSVDCRAPLLFTRSWREAWFMVEPFLPVPECCYRSLFLACSELSGGVVLPRSAGAFGLVLQLSSRPLLQMMNGIIVHIIKTPYTAEGRLRLLICESAKLGPIKEPTTMPIVPF